MGNRRNRLNMEKIEEQKCGLVVYKTTNQKIAQSLIKILRGFIFHKKVGDTYYLKFQKKYEDSFKLSE